NPQRKVTLPKALHDLEKVTVLPKKQDRWNTNEELASWLTQFDNHSQWLSSTVKIRPESGSMFLYNRKIVKYRNDGYLWKKRKDCKTTREDHMKLKIKGVECLYGNYVHSAIIPTFHRRCYWLLQNPDIVLVHYLNVPVTEDRKLTLESLTNGSLIDLPQRDGKTWSTEDIIKQITPMLHGYQIQLNGSTELTPSDSAKVIAQYLLHGQRQANTDSRNCNCLDCTTLRIMAQVPPSPAGSCSSHGTCQSGASTSKGPTHTIEDKNRSCNTQSTLSTAVTNTVKMDESGNINLLIVVANQNNAGNKLQVKSIAPVDSSQNISEVLKGLSGNVQCVSEPDVNVSSGTNGVQESALSNAQHRGLSGTPAPPSPMVSQDGRINGVLPFVAQQAPGSVLQDSLHQSHHLPSTSHQIHHQQQVGSEESQTGVHRSQELTLHSQGHHPKHIGNINQPAQNIHDCMPHTSPQGISGRSILRSPQLVVSSPQPMPTPEGHQLPLLLTSGTQQCNPFGLSQEMMQSIHAGNQNNPGSLNHGHQAITPPATSEQLNTFKMPGVRLPTDNRPTVSMNPPQLILQPAPSNTTKPAQFILKASEAKEGEAPKFILKPADGQDNLSSQGVAPRQFILKAVTSSDLQGPQMNPVGHHVANSTLPAPALGSSHNMHGSVSHPALQQMVTDANIVAAEAKSASHFVRTEGSPGQHSGLGQSTATLTERNTIQAQMAQVQSKEVSGQLKITGQESAELRQMVNGDPKLKTLENRFKDHRSDLVMLPERVQEHYLQMQAVGRLTKDGPHAAADTSMHHGASEIMAQPDTPVSMIGISSAENTPPETGIMAQRTSPGRIDLTYQHSVNSSHGYCSENSEFPTLSEFNSIDHDGNFTSQEQNSLLSDILSAGPGSFQEDTPSDSNLGFSKGVHSTSDLGSLPSPSNIELDFDSFDLMESPLPELGASLLAASSPHSSIGDFGQEESQRTPSAEQGDGSSAPGTSAEEHSQQLCDITDFSPEWSYTEGGVKVLVTGPWHSADDVYSCVFDQTSVAASLIQTGVLRCYCPAHDEGKCELNVTCNGALISKPRTFEYKARDRQSMAGTHDWLSFDENRFKMAILERLEQIEQRLGMKGSSGSQVTGGNQAAGSFEDRVVSICQDLMRRRDPATSPQIQALHTPQRGMTLLHLAAALGYSRLISALIVWRRDHNSIVAELELDPMNKDHASCTPLMWACALGHLESALLLYRWRPHCLKISDSIGRLPLDVAKSRGHASLAEGLTQASQEGQRAWGPPGTSPPSDPIQIPRARNHHNVPAFMVSSPTTNTPSSSLSDDSAPLFEAQSPSSGCLSNLSVSPSSQGLVTPNSAVSPQLSPRLTDTLAGHGSTLNVQQGFLRRDSSGSGKSQSPHHLLGASSPQAPGSSSMPIPPPISQATLNAFLSGSQLLGDLDAVELMGLQTKGDREQADQREMWESFVKELQTAAQQQEMRGAGEDDGMQRRCDSPMQTDDYIPLLHPRASSGNKEQYLSLAEQILDALPDHIKLESSRGSLQGSSMEAEGVLSQADQESMQDTLSSMASSFSSPGVVEDTLYRPGLDNSPASSYSGAESSCHTSSPSNISFDEENPPADWSEFLQGPGHALQWAFSILTLSDEEQRQLYQAALVIQNAFRQYKGRQQQKQQELEAAVIIQSYYRRYKQYICYKSMSEAARVIQNKFRSFQSYRQFQRSRRAAIIIQNSYRTYRAQEQFRKSRDAAILIQQRFRDKRKARMKREQEAARKIQRFLRRYHNRVRTLKQSQDMWAQQTP
ncbi:calmodulin-binding transcription activator 1-like, partial [Diadema antillarum]|uniref:calmodulin-binding transcription activator 1-like n=1 Tax=Diadema antillarum TaxID=105358 RepID=UPI003A8C38F9